MTIEEEKESETKIEISLNDWAGKSKIEIQNYMMIKKNQKSKNDRRDK